MNVQPDSHDDAVRRLLAEARHDEPMPADVADRLDRVLAQLAESGPVDELAARRRKRAGALLLAAAAVVVAGIGVGQLDLAGQPGGADSDSAISADRDDAFTEQGAANGGGAPSEGDMAAEAAPAPAAGSLTSGGLAKATELRLNEENFGRQVKRLQRSTLVADSGARLNDYGAAYAAGFACAPARYGEGDLFAVRYERTPAVLAYRIPAGETQVVELLQCGTAVTLRSVTLPLP